MLYFDIRDGLAAKILNVSDDEHAHHQEQRHLLQNFMLGPTDTRRKRSQATNRSYATKTLYSVEVSEGTNNDSALPVVLNSSGVELSCFSFLS